MDVSPLPAARAAAPAAAAGMEDFEKGTLGGAPPPSRRGLSFGDLLDAVNPLHHIPVLSSLYRTLTGDAISPAARVAGGLLYGGPAGALIAGVTAGVEEASGGDLLGSAVAALTGAGDSGAAPQAAEAAQLAAASEPAAPEPPVAESPPPEPTKRRATPTAVQSAEPVAQATAAPAAPAAQPVSLAMAVDAPARSGLRGKDIRAYIAESMPAGMPARMPGRSSARTPDIARVTPQPALPLPPRGAQAAAQKDIPELPGWFAERMLGGLDKYRAAAGADLAAAGSSVDERR